MSKNEMITMIETMNNYDDLAAKAKAKADAIREAIKEEMIRQDTEAVSYTHLTLPTRDQV